MTIKVNFKLIQINQTQFILTPQQLIHWVHHNTAKKWRVEMHTVFLCQITLADD